MGSYKLLQGESFFPPGVHKTRPTKKKTGGRESFIGSDDPSDPDPSTPDFPAIHIQVLWSQVYSAGDVWLVGWLVAPSYDVFFGGAKNIHEILRVIMQSSMTHQDGGFRNDILFGKIQAKELTQHIFQLYMNVHLSIVLDQPSPRTFDIPRLLLRLKDLGVTTN